MTPYRMRARSALALLSVLAAFCTVPAAPASAAEVLPLADAVGRLHVVPERGTAPGPGAFPHWNAGLVPGDGCDTRGEVLLAEAVEAPSVGADCRLTGGTWAPYTERATVAGAGALVVAHTVPLAEAWESGADGWSAARREAYANDQGAPQPLTVLTAGTHRARGDRDPADWIPPEPSAHCRYVAEWVSTKLRWGLDADTAESEAVKVFAEGPCEDTVVHYTAVPAAR
ncbi:HNH endonuclease [Streptomyces genisteinicus]|uniref:HNH endonuclease n=1 Tax=Streptomyces genisteinicus TaxID=2768068 RepID=A0A7H0HMQ1_9ACTN|nr:HNH endonuclease [Streptomyces genisteinicus]QNP61817.1 HNH endonuclease [Streptomyces genisteinicus]